MSLVKVLQIKKNFGRVIALNGVTLELEPKQQYAIMGASGSGKSTLLYLLGGLDRPTSGEIWVNKQNIRELNDEQLALYRNRFVGFVFQFHFLLPSMTCFNNICLPAKIAGISIRSIRKEVYHLADKLDISHCLKKYSYELSGGEQQRINIIRALILKPKLLLCDEPTGNLDSHNSEKVINLLTDLAETYGSTLVVVTHNEKVSAHFSRIFTLQDGKLLQ